MPSPNFPSLFTPTSLSLSLSDLATNRRVAATTSSSLSSQAVNANHDAKLLLPSVVFTTALPHTYIPTHPLTRPFTTPKTPGGHRSNLTTRRYFIIY
ncbi:unnamed protein product [Protopolystoma xenopodis]|uniref:Uncharacterized protein n=1 Tax=Protopolystoma xenopodis TaxID=117903 RepID=A0A3S5AMK8_9PLAT|nr:unnamed protein product [Protopolystoma xenopodis]